MASGKHLQRSLIPKDAANLKQQTKYLNKKADFIEGWQRNGDDAQVILSIKLLQDSFQCFSAWSKQEMNEFWRFSEKLHQYTWQQVFSTASKVPSQKSGIAYTVIDSLLYPKTGLRAELDPQTTFFELRVSSKARVHGFRDKALFYLCWLDRNHEICK